MLVYVNTITNRLKYTFDLVLRDLVGIDYDLTTDAASFGFFTGPKFTYGREPLGDELFFYATDLLFEKKIHRQDIAVFEWNDVKAFFATHPKYVLPFDPFAASFYMISRYEEYLPYRPDKHGRFDAPESLAFQKNFLNKPLVNIYARRIRQVIKEAFPVLSFRESKYQFISTIDIDNAWAYKEKGLIRTCGALLRSLGSLEFKDFTERLAVIAGKKKDPYDTYDTLHELQQKYSLQMIYFFLLGDYAENDKNVSISNKKFQSLIKSIADYSDTGIHPSFESNRRPGRLQLELSRLEKTILRDVTRSRQHFLKLSFPDTYRNLIEAGITEDYTMGFAGEIGFRAGICTPYYFYDLGRETETRLRINPFMVMDATLKYYMKIKPTEVISYVGPLIKEVKAVNGTFILLWHNESLSGIKPWEGWQGVYEDIIKAARS
jgi:hypothetical protein